MPEPLTLSIVTPSFNTGRHIAAAIDSVLHQDWPGVDYLVMDGGSTDATLDVLRGYGDRVRWASEPDAGQSDAINKGFARTKGDVLGWLNADDVYAPGAFASVMHYFEANPDVALVYGNADYIDSAGQRIAPCVHIEPHNYRRLLHYSDYIVQPAAFFRRSAFDAVGGLDANLNWTMDYDLWLKLASRFQVAHISTLLAHYRWLADNKTATGGFARLAEITRTLATHGADTPAYVRLEYVNLHLQQSLKSLRAGVLPNAAKSLTHAATMLFSSHRSMISMLQPRTWRIIWTGQVLRARVGRG